MMAELLHQIGRAGGDSLVLCSTSVSKASQRARPAKLIAASQLMVFQYD
jgi:hypothetical protein